MFEQKFASREEASIAAAERMAASLTRRIGSRGKASLVVSGGSTPARCFEVLSQADLEWSNVHVALSDERWVAADAVDSNEKLVRESLLVGAASRANLLGVYREDTDIGIRCAEIDQEIRDRPFPFASVLLGMGTDGHFASLFPDAQNLKDSLNLDSTQLCVPVKTAASPHPRVSLTLSALSRSDEIVLLIFGDEKWRVYEAAKSSEGMFPVSHLLQQKRAPVVVCWAP